MINSSRLCTWQVYLIAIIRTTNAFITENADELLKNNTIVFLQYSDFD